MKKINIGTRLYEIATMDQYTECPDMYDARMTAIQIGNVVLPIRNKTDKSPGVYYQEGNFVCTVVKPDEEELSKYSSDNIIDYTKCKDIGDIISNDELVRNIENEILTTKDNIFNLTIGAEDTAEMAAVKEAINSKRIDIKQYEQRFDQFQNDLRLLRGKSITLAKMKSVCEKLDLEADIVLRDKAGCPNPMGKEITVKITGDGGDDQ